MKLRCEHIKKTCAIGVQLLFLIMMHTGLVYIFAVKRIFTCADPLLSAQGVRSLRSALADYTRSPMRGLYDRMRHLKTACPYIEEVRMQREPNSSLQVHVGMYRPWIALMQQGSVMLANNYCIAMSSLQPEALDQLMQVDTPLVHDQQGLNRVLYDTLCALDEQLFARAHIVCKDPYEVRISLPHDPIEIVCNRDHLPDAALIERCKVIAGKAAYAGGIVADIRFENQIIVSQRQVRG